MAGLNLNLNAFTENASRLGARISESITEHTRDFAIARGPGSSYFDVPEDKVRNVRRQLDLNSDREKLDGLKTLIALISKGRNVSEFFPYVVKNVASQNLEIRKLVYIFLLRYAETDPDLALLSINTFQKDLTDSNPLIRAMALRVLSGINVPMVGNIVILAIKKCAGDPSPYVRKAAALALIKCFSMDSAHLTSLIPILSMLLKEKSPLSIGAVAVAFQRICPTRLDLLHKNYRRLCCMLIDVDAWGQVSLLDVLSHYARSMLARPIDAAQGSEIDQDLQLLLTSADPLFMSRNPAVVIAVARLFYYLAPASQMAKIVTPLLRVLHLSKEEERVTLSYLEVISRKHSDLFVAHYSQFFIRSTDIWLVKQCKLRILLRIVSQENYQILLREFLVYAEDSDERLVTEAIQAIGRCAKLIPDSAQQCLVALLEFIKYGSEIAISASVLVLKSLVQSQLELQRKPLPSNISTIYSPLRIIADLAGRIDEINHPAARACILWLVGQYAEVPKEDSIEGFSGIAFWAPDVLRRIAKSFTLEASTVKLQAITLAAKLQILASDSDKLLLLTRYVYTLARYDTNCDVRERARMLGALLSGAMPGLRLLNAPREAETEDQPLERAGVILRREQVRLVLFEGKSVVEEKEIDSGASASFGSLGVVTGNSMGLETSRRLPDWPEEGTDSSLRDAEEEYSSLSSASHAVGRAVSGSSGMIASPSPVVLTPTGGASPLGSYNARGEHSSKDAWMDLDKFYEDAESDDEYEDDEGEGLDDESEESAEEDGDNSAREDNPRLHPSQPFGFAHGGGTSTDEARDAEELDSGGSE